MKILMINKFLHPNGGSETYIFKLGQCLEKMGHEVQFFGMEHAGRVVGNRAESYTRDMDFHGGSKLAKLTYPVKTVYSREARKKLRAVLEDFKPDVCHLNNFNYQLTPSVILEIRAWSKKRQHPCRILYTAHDYQLVCPNHMCRNPGTDENCEKCLSGKFSACAKGRCIHNSRAKSAVGTVEAYYWKKRGVYRQIDTVICCSHFIKSKLDTNPVFASKTVVMHNFIDSVSCQPGQKQDYVLYFGRFSPEKGVKTLLDVCRSLPQIPFVFAGTGPLEGELTGIDNIRNVGFLTGQPLQELIARARFTVYPSEWYENCPFSVMESQVFGTPVLGARIGGIPELIQDGKTGLLFTSGDPDDLREKILALWQDADTLQRCTENCRQVRFDTTEGYCKKLLTLYKGNDAG